MADERSSRSFLVKEIARLSQALQEKCLNCPQLAAAKKEIERLPQLAKSKAFGKRDED